jgi:hypothetical protein
MRIGHVEKIFFEFSVEDWEQLDSLLLSYISLFPSHEARDSLGLLQVCSRSLFLGCRSLLLVFWVSFDTCA